MRWSALLLAVLCLAVGIVWILQGAGVLPGSFMTGQRLWLVIGIVLALVGLVLGYIGLRRPARG
ncbi:MAG TPA: hypothetical protein VET65_02240 [Candidatus Limnocylindrales bacterium]|nr:hypothetical protein [Candidatus Limnocylindrales bacterium]